MDFQAVIPASAASMLGIVILVLTVVVRLVFAAAVAQDAADYRTGGQPTVLVSGGVWAIATLIGGVFVAVAYWILHRTTFGKVG